MNCAHCINLLNNEFRASLIHVWGIVVHHRLGTCRYWASGDWPISCYIYYQYVEGNCNWRAEALSWWGDSCLLPSAFVCDAREGFLGHARNNLRWENKRILNFILKCCNQVHCCLEVLCVPLNIKDTSSALLIGSSVVLLLFEFVSCAAKVSLCIDWHVWSRSGASTLPSICLSVNLLN